MISKPVGFKSLNLNSMCTNTATYLVVKMKLISFAILECSRIPPSLPSFFPPLTYFLFSFMLAVPLQCSKVIVFCAYIII